MKTLLKWEEAAMFLLSICLIGQLHYAWYWWLVWILAPDFSMIGYIVNTKFGAVCYNIVHHKGVAVALYLIGLYTYNQALQFAGLILFGHSSMDRGLGYGLKYPDSFQNTHLGRIGIREKQTQL